MPPHMPTYRSYGPGKNTHFMFVPRLPRNHRFMVVVVSILVSIVVRRVIFIQGARLAPDPEGNKSRGTPSFF